MQDFTDLPSMSTVQAPQWLVSQPICGAGEVLVLAQEVDQQRARLDQRLDRLAVDRQGYLGLRHGSSASLNRPRGTGPARDGVGDLCGLGGDRCGVGDLAEAGAVGHDDGVGADAVVLRQQHGAVQGVFEFADIARPGRAEEGLAGVLGERARRQAVGLRIFCDEVIGERDDVTGTFAQWRQFEVHDVEAEQQILAEAAVANGIVEVAIGGGDDADIDWHGAGAADAIDDAFLDGAQQFGLQAHIHLGDFVEQQGAAGGFLELADAARDGAGEGALFVAEQFALEQVLGDGGAVDRNEGAVDALRLGVKVLGHHFLAGAAFAGDQHRGIGGGDLFGEFDDARHAGIAEQEVGGFAGHGGDDGGDQLGVGRQRDVFLGAGADGVDGSGGIGLGAAGDDRNVEALGVERGDQAGDVDHHIDEEQIGAAAGAEARHRDLDARGVGDLGAALHGELGGFGELALEGSDDEQSHGANLP